MSDIKRISPEEVKRQLEQKEDMILLDIRSKEEYREGHIEGATLLPLPTLLYSAEEVLPEKSKRIYLYCRSGVRTLTAYEILTNLGYTEVYDMGGIISWPYEIVNK